MTTKLSRRSPAEDLVTDLGDGTWRVTMPAGWTGPLNCGDVPRMPEDVIRKRAIDSLLASGPMPVSEPAPREPKPTHEEQRVAVISRTAMSEREFKAALANEGLDAMGVRWVEPTAEEKQARMEQRRHRELDGLKRAEFIK